MKNLLLFGIVITTIFLANIYQLGAIAPVSAQTVPTRTSTPKPTETKVPGNGNNGGNNPTNTPIPVIPTATATATEIPVTTVNTPEGGYYPTAEPCSNQPTIIASNNTNVRSGPDTSYAIVGQIVFLEVRPILGRAQNANWWLISLADGTAGWVFDEVVTVNGYIDVVPIMTEPAGNGEIWNPTPNPSCTVTPTSIPTETPIPTATPEAITTGRTVIEEVPTETAVPPTEPPTLVPQPTRVTDPTATPSPTPVPIDPPATGSNSNLLFIGAIGLLLVGGIVFIVKRN